MRAADIMSSPVYGITADAGIEEAAALMVDHGFTTLPVISAAGVLLGVVTESDLVRARFVPGPRGESSPDHGVIPEIRPYAVRQVMQGALSLRPELELSDVADAMIDSHQRCLPVVDGRDRVIGIVSWRDLLAGLSVRR